MNLLLVILCLEFGSRRSLMLLQEKIRDPGNGTRDLGRVSSASRIPRVLLAIHLRWYTEPTRRMEMLGITG